MTGAGAERLPITVLICDDHAPSRIASRALLNADPGIRVIAEAADGAAAVERARRHRPDVVLMDLRMPVMDGIEATRRIRGLPDPPHVIVLTTFDDDDAVVRALHAGADGFLLKGDEHWTLPDAVHVVVSGDALLSPQVTRRLLGAVTHRVLQPPAERDRLLDSLSEREREVLQLVALGLTNHEIAERMAVSETTVKTYVSRVLIKVDRRNRVELALLCYQHGLV